MPDDPKKTTAGGCIDGCLGCLIYLAIALAAIVLGVILAHG